MTTQAQPMRCFRCGRAPDEIDEYVDAAPMYGTTPEAYVREHEGTYNKESHLFACTECYSALGSPSAARGWIAPDRGDLSTCPRCSCVTFSQYFQDVDVGVGIDRCYLNGGHCISCGVLVRDSHTNRWSTQDMESDL